MANLTRIEVDCSTGEQKVIELTDAEMVEYHARVEQANIDRAKRKAAEQAKADAKLAAQAKLQALGLTGEEIAAITE